MNCTLLHHFSDEAAFLHWSIVHGLGNNLCIRFILELHEGISLRPPCLFGSGDTQTSYIAKLCKELFHLFLIEAVWKMTQVDHTSIVFMTLSDFLNLPESVGSVTFPLDCFGLLTCRNFSLFDLLFLNFLWH